MSAAAASASPLSLSIAQLNAAGALNSGSLSADALLAASESVFRLASPSFPPTSGAFMSTVQRLLQSQPIELFFALHQSEVVGVLVLRVHENTFNGTRLFI